MIIRDKILFFLSFPTILHYQVEPIKKLVKN